MSSCLFPKWKKETPVFISTAHTQYTQGKLSQSFVPGICFSVFAFVLSEWHNRFPSGTLTVQDKCIDVINFLNSFSFLLWIHPCRATCLYCCPLEDHCPVEYPQSHFDILTCQYRAGVMFEPGTRHVTWNCPFRLYSHPHPVTESFGH